MGTIEMFDHTADVGLRVMGSDWNDIFVTSAEGLFDYIVVNRESVAIVVSELITLSSDSTERLLVLWLNELIFLLETKHRLFRSFDVAIAPDGKSLNAIAKGEAIDRERHTLDHEVKAVTYHDLRLERVPQGLLAELILDI